MKKIFFQLGLFIAATVAMAVPAKRGLWRDITLADGSVVRAELRGDEFAHYWVTEDCQRYSVGEDGTAIAITDEQLTQQSAARRQRANSHRLARRAKKKAQAAESPYLGQKKGLILLVSFSNETFMDENDHALYENIANTPGFTNDMGFEGSVSDYFKAQSLGKFELTFDVVGPLMVSKTSTYYGKNDSRNNDLHPAEMVIEAVNLAKEQIDDWSKYDWDNDGEVDQVMIIYAGHGEASGGASNTIWPHEYELSSAAYYGDGTGPVTVAEGLVVDTYAVANERNKNQQSVDEIGGIGTICHEFSHCLGLMDMYDTEYSGFFGMYDWSLMDNGSYNEDGFVPAGYTSYEKYSIGWLNPVELTTETTITNMQPLTEADEAYIVHNAAHPDEYYLLENRQLQGWDKGLPAGGMLILHVDYDQKVWYNNVVNAKCNENDHERCTIFHADGKNHYNTYKAKILSTSSSSKEYYDWVDKFYDDIEGDVYPQPGNNQLTNTSTPRAFLYNKNADGRKLMNVSITDITQNEDGSMSFHFAPDNSGSGVEGDNTDSDYGGGNSGGGSGGGTVIDLPEGVLFYESFDLCDGTGGNDNSWSGTVASSAFDPDNKGWVTTKSYGGYKCARFGTNDTPGSATTPTFNIDGDAELTFYAGAWKGSKDGTQLSLFIEGETVTTKVLTISKGEFSICKVPLSGHGTMKITFKAVKGRFFLDEVVVADNSGSGINNLRQSAAPGVAYDLCGRKVNTMSLDKGVYVQDGKKFVVR